MIASLLLFGLTALVPASPLDDVLLEGLDGQVRRRPLAGLNLTDPRDEEAVLLRLPAGETALSPSGAAEDRAIFTVGRDRIQGWVRGGDGDRVQVALVGNTVLTLLVDELSSLEIPGRIPRDADGRPEPAEEGDRIYLLRRGGLDRLDGLLHGFTAEGIAFESRLGLETYLWADVVSLFIEVFEEPAPQQGGEADARTPVVVDLRGGSRLRGRMERLNGEGLTLATPGQPSLTLPVALIESLAVDDGSFVFLSELDPADLGPLSPTGDELGMTWPPRFDLAVDGSPLRAEGRTWSRGIGVHAPSRLTWKLDGSWKQLRTRAAIDDQVATGSRRGSVVFRIHVDGEVRFESEVVGAGDAAIQIPPIDLNGANELVLEVDPTSDLWVSDRADWLSPVLVAGG